MKISIITVVFNGAETIEDCIKSIIGQTYPGIEHIIIDGGSTDGTLDVINKYNRNIAKIVSEPDNGLYDAMNKGLKLATGNIVGFINSDDMLNTDDCIEEIVKKFKETKADVIYGDKIHVNHRDLTKIVRYWDAGEYDRNNFKKGWMPPHLSFYAKKEVYDKYGTYRIDLKIASDYELMFRFLYKHNVTAVHLPKVIAKMRIGGVSTKSYKNILLQNYEVYKSWALNGCKVSPLIILRKPLIKITHYFARGKYIDSRGN